MNIKYINHSIKAAFLGTFFFLTACSNSSSSPSPSAIDNKYLQTHTFLEKKDKETLKKSIQDIFSSGSAPTNPFLTSILNSKIKHPVSLYQISYKTQTPNSQETTASGLVIIPQTDNLPILSYQHGTVTLKEDAPSISFDKGDASIAQILASSGYITVLPDYLGLGSSETFHPFVHKTSSATTTKHMLQASLELLQELGISHKKQYALLGYSEGGFVTMATQELLQQEPVPEYTFITSIPMAGPYDLAGVMAPLMLQDSISPNPFFLPYALHSYHSAYPDLKVKDLLLTPYQDSINVWFNGNRTSSSINTNTPNPVKNILLNDKAWPPHLDSLLQINSTLNFTAQVPTRLMHCTGDTYVPIANSRNAFKTLSVNNNHVDTIFIPDLDHIECIGQAFLKAGTYLDSIFTSQ